MSMINNKFGGIAFRIKIKERCKFGFHPKEFHKTEKECIIDPDEVLEPGDMPTNYFYLLSIIPEKTLKHRRWTIVDVI